jgi:hypothetical protein
MHSNNSDIIVVDAVDCGSGGGGLTQLRPNQCGGSSQISKVARVDLV